ncbi:MAG: hypothetical protein FRX49_04654 [Trebouxia sp. A1-2]|nr:MAG: hypothetical protein FRX49_04654 [Trebouxia sp. A1-2]
MTPLDPCRLKPSLEPDPLLCRPSTQEPCLRGSLPSPPAIDTRLDPCFGSCIALPDRKDVVELLPTVRKHITADTRNARAFDP